ncbi:ABC transporter permease [Pseudomonas saliphila]|uniref:ABC transporter permease n=1 Tax=Pseudomonas saliphila TaxID=2586906 RepID=UPI001F48BBE7|nr:ABC transporter permease [Pseudomonas saliphila]
MILALTKRDIAGRYRGSFFGVFWSFLTPILMLSVFTFVFGEIFQSRWGEGDLTGPLDFAVALFAGLLVFNFFSECISKAPGLVIANANYVKKVVFPLEILTITTLLAALFHLLAGYVILLILMVLSNWELTLHMLYIPIVLLPFVILVLGLTWGLSALGVYLRDISQLIGPVLTAMMFLSPIFYSVSSVDAKFQWIYALNPLTLVIEQARAVMLMHQTPDWSALGLYMLLSLAVAYAGFIGFQTTRKGFADVI